MFYNPGDYVKQGSGGAAPRSQSFLEIIEVLHNDLNVIGVLVIRRLSRGLGAQPPEARAF